MIDQRDIVIVLLSSLPALLVQCRMEWLEKSKKKEFQDSLKLTMEFVKNQPEDGFFDRQRLLKSKYPGMTIGQILQVEKDVIESDKNK